MNTTYGVPHSPTLRRKYEEGQAEGREEGRAEEAVKRERKTIVMLLKARDLTPSTQQRELVDTCEDLDMLELWSERAEAATSTDDVFK